jgi:hypothetical protein
MRSLQYEVLLLVLDNGGWRHNLPSSEGMGTLGCLVLQAFPQRGQDPGESFAPTLVLVPMMAASTGVVYLYGGIVVDLCFLFG